MYGILWASRASWLASLARLAGRLVDWLVGWLAGGVVGSKSE